MELIILGGHADGIVTKTLHKTQPGSLFVCLKLALVHILKSDLFKFTEVVYQLLCMSMLLIV